MIIFLQILINAINCQIQSIQESAGTVSQPAPSQAPACNPFISKCPDAACGMPASAGGCYIASPNATSIFYHNELVNITWYYVDSDPEYPVSSVNICKHFK